MKIISKDKNQQRLAKIPHEIFTLNVTIIHLFLAVAMLKFGNPKNAIILPICISIIIIIWTYFRTKKAHKKDTLLVKIHWQLSLSRYKFLIFAYVFYFVIIFIANIITSGEVVGMNGESISQNIFLILAVIPLFIIVLLSAILGSGSIFNAGRGEVPKKLL